MDRGRLEREASRLVDFARAARHPLGFGWLDDTGRLTDRPPELWITCRMTHVFSLAALRGDESCLPPARHGVASLRGALRDPVHGGWYAAVGADGTDEPVADRKEAYGHAFVVLAAASARAAGVDGADDLLAEALDVLDRRFWEDGQGMVRESWDRAWGVEEEYRGVNATMHVVEALLAAHEVTGDPVLLDRAGRMTRRVLGFARERDHRLPEHFTPTWQPVLDHHRDDPAHPFRPYGVTVGHLLEWSRLALQVRHAEGGRDVGLLRDAEALFARAVGDGWQEGVEPGFCYTTDFAGRPVVRERMHWVVAEAVAASWVLGEVTGDPAYVARCERWLDLALTRFADPDGGSWWHELDEANRPSAVVWQGKPDVYHAYQAVLTPVLPLASSYVGAVRAAAG
jgi:mannose/cellobiose epimerase-like protein (N-acyl-D-glucosamine 2-epimerase family)